MFKILCGIVGLIVGASGGFEFAVVAAMAGIAIGAFLDRTRDGASRNLEIAELRAELASLKGEFAELRRRVDAREPKAPDVVSTPPSTPSERPAMPDSGRPASSPSAAPPDGPTAVPADTARPTIPARVAAATAVVQPTVFEAQIASNVATAPPIPSPRRSPTASGKDETPAEPAFNLFMAARNWLFGGNTLVRVGVVVLFFGLAFLVKFAAEHAVVPVELRYVGVGIGALVALAIGWRLRESRPGYAMAMQGLAVAALYLAVFAAYRLHGLLPGGLTFALLVATCALSALLAILQDARSMAVIGICGGFLAPVLASTGGGSHVALFSYYALLNAGILGITWAKAWRPLNVLGFLFTFGIGAAWGERYYRDDLFATTEPFLLLFFAFYLAIALLYARRRRAEIAQIGSATIAGEPVDYVDGTLVFGAPIAAFGLQYLMVRDMPFGTAFSALGLGLIYLPLALALARRGRDEMRMMIESFLALGLVFASLAIPLALDAKWTSAAWAAEGAGIYWVSARQRRRWARAFALLLQFGAGASLWCTIGSPGSVSVFGLPALLDGSVLGTLFVGAAGLATALVVRRQSDDVTQTERDIRPLFVLWGLVFLNLAFPLLLDQRWTGVAWALSGCAVILAGLRTEEVTTLLFGAVLQIVGGAVLGSLAEPRAADTAVLNVWWIGAALVAGAGWISGWRLHRAAQAPEVTAGRPELASLLRGISIGALLWSLAWWWSAGHGEIVAHVSDARLAADIGFAAATALGLLLLAHLFQWPAAQNAALLLLPALVAFAAEALGSEAHPFAHHGWIAWPAALTVLGLVLRRQEGGPFGRWLALAHVAALWLVCGLATWQGWWWFSDLGGELSAWPVLGWALGPVTIVALLLAAPLQTRWPLVPHASAYRLGLVPVAFGLWCWVFFANLASDGSAAPLPYLPLANPLDLAVAGTLLALLGWARRTADDAPILGGPIRVAVVLGTTAFFWLNGLLLRSLHHWADVPFDFDAMMASTLVQAALSLFWAAIALALMLFATRRGVRPVWFIGGALMAGVVGKLFLIDLARVGTVERIVSFIGVGILLLVLGYFSPVPPRREETQ